ncbi:MULTISPECIES: molybdopterin-dependent oxidoreductase [unclassified Microbacterium]|uniref:molybdopterin-dependent oxidoreductase n=1 Tax=unclassified Microbacterium TaxID=2609290 RepID=UPI000C2BBFE1|nr:MULTISPECIES: molybdopterin-dependent oxidoreductase [unclassified Microbacterium]
MANPNRVKRPGTKRFLAWAALAGVVSAAVFLAIAELLALLFARGGSPLLAVGSFVIDIVPQPFKEFAIATFGEYDKIALLVGLGLAVLIASAIAGILELVRPPLGAIALGIAGVLSVAAVVTRAGATALSWIPSVAGAVAGAALVVVLGRMLRAWRSGVNASSGSTSGAAAGVARRRFLLIGGIAAAGAVVVGIGSRVAGATTSSIAAIRRGLNLPAPRTTVTVPAGAELDIPGISPLYTPNADFYRVDTALTVPSVDPGTWRLSVVGMVDTPLELTFDDLVGMGLDEYSVTLTCVSNEVGGDLVGTAKWWGVPIRDVLRAAGPAAGADMVLSRSVDGFTASTPLESLTDDGLDAILAVAMNGEALPLEHGFPVRMVVPGLYGYVSATKWLTELKVTTFADDEAYWTPRGYSAQAPIKMSSRIDTPRPGNPVAAGRVPIAGVAWAQTVGIDRVEVSIDDGDWQVATLSTAVGVDTWVQWFVDWDATPGTHYVTVRAVNAAGETQTQERAPIAPDGSSGWQRTLVTVT